MPLPANTWPGLQSVDLSNVFHEYFELHICMYRYKCDATCQNQARLAI